ncbi:MAG: hypothetical protein QW117_02235 [Candidatus Pacearchaeota archaeon]
MVKKRGNKKECCLEIKDISCFNLFLIKVSVFFFTLFIVSLLNINAINNIIKLRWIWFILSLIFVIKPIKNLKK